MISPSLHICSDYPDHMAISNFSKKFKIEICVILWYYVAQNGSSLRFVKSQKSAGLIHTATEGWNQENLKFNVYDCVSICNRNTKMLYNSSSNYFSWVYRRWMCASFVTQHIPQNVPALPMSCRLFRQLSRGFGNPDMQLFIVIRHRKHYTIFSTYS